MLNKRCKKHHKLVLNHINKNITNLLSRLKCKNFAQVKLIGYKLKNRLKANSTGYMKI